MNCQQANEIDLVDYLASLGFKPVKIRQNDYWYLSPYRSENTASFKVSRSKNVWFDHGSGEGGTLVDFAARYFGCGLNEALHKIETGNNRQLHRVGKVPELLTSNPENHIQIIRIDNSIRDLLLRRYLNSRQIDKSLAERFCKQVLYENAGKRFLAIGFKNNLGGYELRSENFKGSSAPKYVTWFNNQADSISVFEGFFDLMTWHSIKAAHHSVPTNILVLNSLSFFTRSLLLQEKYPRIHLYLDNDTPGRQCVQEILKRNPGKVVDESRQYKDFKDLNEWHVEKLNDQHIKHSKRIGF